MDFTKAVFVKSVLDVSQLPRDNKPQVAFFGRSNVGKSSLINSLTRQKGMSRSSNTPGRTRSINLFLADESLYLIDLPGYGYTKASKETSEKFQKLIIDYLDAKPPLRLAVVILDVRHEPTAQDVAMVSSIVERDLPVAVVANKIDKLSNSEAKNRLRKLQTQFPNLPVVRHSAETKDGRGEILDLIDRARTWPTE
jgi:GTP-binding protein